MPVKRWPLISLAGAGALLAIFLTLKNGPQAKGSHRYLVAARCLVNGAPKYVVADVRADPATDAGLAAGLAERADLLGCDFTNDIIEDTSAPAGWPAQPNAVRTIATNPPFNCACGVARRKALDGTWGPWAYLSGLRIEDTGTDWQADAGPASMKRHPCVVLAGAHDLVAEGLCDH